MRNCNNCAHLEWANGGRHEDSGQPLTQELLNSIMRTPGESRATAAPALPKCPRCEERYCGDGVQLCTECVASNAQPSTSTARMKTQEAIAALRKALAQESNNE